MSVKILLSGKLTLDSYVHAVENAGAVAVAEYLPKIDTSFDGLVLCGGSDVHPQYYNEEINGAVDMDLPRDQLDFPLLKAYIEAGKPVLGICRGCQLINIYFGGTLHQHLKNTVLHRSGKDIARQHEVYSSDDEMIRSLYGHRFIVNSIHHQAIKTLGKDLTATMYSDDGIIEGFKHNSLPIFAVQWHPERMIDVEQRRQAVDGNKIFKYFIDMCANRQL